MPLTLKEHLYGQSREGVTRLDRGRDPHRVSVATVSVQLEGDFEDSYLAGDNHQVIATDSMKNTVEPFGLIQATVKRS